MYLLPTIGRSPHSPQRSYPPLSPVLTAGSPVPGSVVLVGVVTVITDPERCGGAAEHPQALQPVSESRLDLDLHLETVTTFVLLFGLVLDFYSVILLQLWGAAVGWHGTQVDLLVSAVVWDHMHSFFHYLALCFEDHVHSCM